MLAWGSVGALFGAAGLDTGAGDWDAHVYRVRELGRHGLASWTHDWAGGLPLWSSYQFVPHAIIAAAVRLTGATEARAMVVGQGVLIFVLVSGLYGVLRLGRIGAGPALVGALLALVFDDRLQPVSTFSELWGLAVAPLLLGLAYASAGRRAGYAVAAVIGLSVYLHPLALLTGCLGLIAAAIARGIPGLPIGFSRRALRLVLTWLVALSLQLLVSTGTAAFFWMPAVWSARPVYEHPYFSSAAFQRTLAGLATRSFASGWPLWLTAATLAASVVAWPSLGVAVRAAYRPLLRRRQPAAPALADGSLPVASVLDRTVRPRRSEQRRMARFLLICGAGLAVLVVTSLAGWGPRLYLNAQAARLLSLAPLLAAGGFAVATAAIGGLFDRPPVIEGGWRSLPAGRPRWLAFTPAYTLGAVILLAILGIAGHDRLAALAADAGARSPSAFTGWLIEQGGDAADGSRIVAPGSVVAEASAVADGAAWYTGSYSGREWSILAAPLAMYLDGFGAPDAGSAYLTVMAAGLVVAPSGVRPALADPRTWQPVAWQEVVALDGVDVLRVPWRSPLAVSVPRGAERGLETPDRPFATLEESYIRDELTRRYAALVLSEAALPATVRPRSGTVLDIELRDLPPERVLLVSENWDRAWRAEAGGVRLPVYRAGPNLIAVDLTGVPAAVGADVHVRLRHVAPDEWRLGALVVALTLAAAVLLARSGPRLPAGVKRG